MQKKGGTNHLVDLSILHHFLCSLVRLKAVNHTFQENFWSCHCAQYSPCNSISGLNIWDMIRYKSYDLSLTCPHQWTSCPCSPMLWGQNQSTTHLQIMWSSHWHFISKFNCSLTIPPVHHHHFHSFFRVLPPPLLSLLPTAIYGTQLHSPPPICVHSQIGLF